nr:MAG TPA: hypothetical protein [Caudoviricetes sp.]
MLIILQVVSFILFVWNFLSWGLTPGSLNENCAPAASIYFLCFILIYLFGG